MGKFEECKTLVKDFMTDSTFHGFPQIVIAPMLWMRIVWVPLVGAAIVFSFQHLADMVVLYKEHPLEVEKRVGVFFLVKY